jgi:hypothetical protein
VGCHIDVVSKWDGEHPNHIGKVGRDDQPSEGQVASNTFSDFGDTKVANEHQPPVSSSVSANRSSNGTEVATGSVNPAE